MSLQKALMRYKKHNEDKAIEEKIAKMLEEQQKLLNGGVEEKPAEPKKQRQFDVRILDNGGNSHYYLNGKWYRVSVDTGEADLKFTQYKFHIRSAMGYRFYVSAKTYSEAQAVVNAIFGNGYRVSGSVI